VSPRPRPCPRPGGSVGRPAPPPPLLPPSRGAGGLLLAGGGERPPAPPRPHGLARAEAARLEGADHLGELVAGLLVAQLVDGSFGHVVLAFVLVVPAPSRTASGSPTMAPTAPSQTRIRSRSPGATSSTDRSTGSGPAPSVTRWTIA